MAEKKARVEPEVSFPDHNGKGDGAGRSGAGENRPSVEDLVPGLGDEISRQDADAAGPDLVADRGADREPDAVADRLATLEGEVADLRDKWTRALAEAENVRRRAERDRRDAEAYGGTKLARDVLAVWDNLERALKAADDTLKTDHAAFFEGVELTQRELLNAFGKHKIEKVTPTRGDKFDPNRHQAMFEAPVPGAEPGTVIEVMQDGFSIAERLLRPALVGVARAVPAAEPAEASEGDGTEEAGTAETGTAGAGTAGTDPKTTAASGGGDEKKGDGNAAA